MDIVESFEHAGFTVEICLDETPESPRQWDNLGTLICWHTRYTLGDFNPSGNVQEYLDRNIPARSVVVPVYLYDHSGLRMNTTGFSCPWDSGQVGVIFCSPEAACKAFNWKRLTRERRDTIKRYLQCEIETLDQYLRGDVYGYEIKDGEELVDSCWGFFGLEYCREQAREAAEFNRDDRAEDDPQLCFLFE